MMKRVFIVHKWDGSPDSDWYPWLKNELKNKDFEVKILKMPNPSAPEINLWVSFLDKSVEKPDKNTFFVGHSIGCQTILRYLENLPENVKVGGVVLVAGWFHLNPEATPDDTYKEIAKPWLEKQINFNKILNHTNNFTVILSDNDPYVPIEDSKIFKEKLKVNVILEKDLGHIEVESAPYILREFLKITK